MIDIREDIEIDLALVKEAQREEREVWKKAIRLVKCTLPDDADTVEWEANRIRNEGYIEEVKEK